MSKFGTVYYSCWSLVAQKKGKIYYCLLFFNQLNKLVEEIYEEEFESRAHAYLCMHHKALQKIKEITEGKSIRVKYFVQTEGQLMFLTDYIHRLNKDDYVKINYGGDTIMKKVDHLDLHRDIYRLIYSVYRKTSYMIYSDRSYPVKSKIVRESLTTHIASRIQEEHIKNLGDGA